MITPNENEAIAMTKEKNIWKAAKTLSRYGHNICILFPFKIAVNTPVY